MFKKKICAILVMASLLASSLMPMAQAAEVQTEADQAVATVGDDRLYLLADGETDPALSATRSQAGLMSQAGQLDEYKKNIEVRFQLEANIDEPQYAITGDEIAQGGLTFKLFRSHKDGRKECIEEKTINSLEPFQFEALVPIYNEGATSTKDKAVYYIGMDKKLLFIPNIEWAYQTPTSNPQVTLTTYTMDLYQLVNTSTTVKWVDSHTKEQREALGLRVAFQVDQTDRFKPMPGEEKTLYFRDDWEGEKGTAHPIIMIRCWDSWSTLNELVEIWVRQPPTPPATKGIYHQNGDCFKIAVDGKDTWYQVKATGDIKKGYELTLTESVQLTLSTDDNGSLKEPTKNTIVVAKGSKWADVKAEANELVQANADYSLLNWTKDAVVIEDDTTFDEDAALQANFSKDAIKIEVSAEGGQLKNPANHSLNVNKGSKWSEVKALAEKLVVGDAGTTLRYWTKEDVGVLTLTDDEVFNNNSTVKAHFLKDVIPVDPNNPGQPPTGYVRISFGAGDHGSLTDVAGNQKLAAVAYDVHQDLLWSKFKKYVPTIVADANWLANGFEPGLPNDADEVQTEQFVAMYRSDDKPVIGPYVPADPKNPTDPADPNKPNPQDPDNPYDPQNYVTIAFGAGDKGKLVNPKNGEQVTALAYLVKRGETWDKHQNLVPTLKAQTSYHFTNWSPTIPKTGEVANGSYYVAGFAADAPPPTPGGGGGGGIVPPNPIEPEKPGAVKPVVEVLNTQDHLAYLFGYPDQSFRPDRNMTRAEVATLFSRLMKEGPVKGKQYASQFSDVSADQWYANSVGFMTEKGYLKGYPDGRFCPNEPITRTEFAALASRFANLTDGDVEFSDVSSDYWGRKVIGMAVTAGWAKGYPDKTFKPNHNITRCEVSAIVNRMLVRQADLGFIKAHLNDPMLKTFIDVQDSGYWGYQDVMDATNSRKYVVKDNQETWTELLKEHF